MSTQQYQSVGKHLFKKGQLAPRVVGGILASTSLCAWVLQRCPSEAAGPSTSCDFPPTSHSEGNAWCLACSTQPVRAEEERVPRAQRTPADLGLLGSVQKTITLAIILQWCAIQVRAPPDTFYRRVQELHRNLALVMDKSDWANMEKRSQQE